MNLSKSLLERCWQTPSEKAIDSGKKCLLDTLGVLIKGRSYSSMSPLNHFLSGLQDKGPSTAIGFGKLPAAEAAFYNGTAAHSVEMDDFHRSATVHPGVVVVPAALAVAEEVGASGEEVLKSILGGYEAMVRVGELCSGVPYKKGFHPTSLCGVFGASAASSYLYRLPQETAMMAFGIAGNFASGLLEYKTNGSWTKRLNAGWASKTGIIAAQLANAGFTGPETILEGRFGFLQAFADSFSLEGFEWDRKAKWAIEDISFKPYASCRFTHAPIDAFLKILKENKISPEAIEHIQVRTHEMAVAATLEPKQRKYRPEEPVDAQFSIPYCLALAAQYRSVLPEHFESQYLRQEDILAIAAKVTGTSDPKYTGLFPGQNGSRVKVKIGERLYAEEVLNAKGDPENPLTKSELETKFRKLVEGAISPSQQEDIIHFIWNLEESQDLKPVMDILKSI
jgi:2-methylcitrate dehydratase PrpD